MESNDRVDAGVRQSGRTTKQLISAPTGAAYIWQGPPSYVRRLAFHLGRDDRVILNADEAFWRLRGRRSAVVVDHHVDCSALPQELKVRIRLLNERYWPAKSEIDSPKEHS